MCCAGLYLRALYVLVLGRSKCAPRKFFSPGEMQHRRISLHQLPVGNGRLWKEPTTDRCVVVELSKF